MYPFHFFIQQPWYEITQKYFSSPKYSLTTISGKLNRVGKGTDHGEGKCLAACDDQINHVSVTSSMFPNRETFVKREEFCITLMKLNKTCTSNKRDFLVHKFPTICVNIESVIERAAPKEVCVDYKWNPVRHFNFLPNDTTVFG